MKIMLSMPRTISNAVNVPSAIHISGFASHSSIDSSLAYVIHTVGLFSMKESRHGETQQECIASWRYALLKGRRTNELQVTLAGHALGCALLGRAGNVQHRRLQSRRWRKPRHLEDLHLVKRLARQEGVGECIELFTVRGQESFGLIMAFADDLAHLGVDGFRRVLAERLLSRETLRPQV